MENPSDSSSDGDNTRRLLKRIEKLETALSSRKHHRRHKHRRRNRQTSRTRSRSSSSNHSRRSRNSRSRHRTRSQIRPRSRSRSPVVAVDASPGASETPLVEPLTISNEDPEADLGDELNELGASFSPVESPPVHFATENSTVVTSQTGSTALIPCIVNNIGDGMVSWIRRKDYHLLTVGLTTYSSDERFQAIHLQHSGDWTLQIRYVQTRDAGTYECQVSSHPPTSIFIHLNVVEARAEILGPSEKYLKPGSGLRLQCNVLQSTELPTYVFWYHNNRMINYDVDRGINVTTTLSEKTSILTITSAATHHSGNYSCVPSNAQPASTYVHILNGENPAAMQHGARGLSWLQCSPSSWLLVLSIINIMC